ncbi:Cys-rich peptide radical SAM maturase CcpM [Clostridium pasteurianum]|uniref:Arylsulfatase regulator (Fe-S oxidoreductase) n=1 Tax=Clostridium pasteurianum BC1 TaxID=86416 RepID=R4KAL5_CLOPA|nr:Cys-rich peptide radical SAM maturase CcpM [Clostridium pasteurianum]AGK99603.1 arylsulfatase regulator (Fe-S oxidoreductase) [Clostridium pasteurianum BC1]
MLINKPFIKLFKTRSKYYMYDVNKNTILNIDNKQYTFLKNCLEFNDNCFETKEVNRLYKDGFLSSNKVKNIVHPAEELLPYYLNNNVQMLILQVTQQCNFRCEYCVYSGAYLNRSHSNKKMDISTALKGIDFIINHSSNVETINIGFYGGEPLLEFNFIKKCIEYAEEKSDCKKIIFSMTTNASLLTDEIVEFLYKHSVLLTISLDGPKEIHNSHRKLALNNNGSFDKVINNIVRIEKKFPEYIKTILFNTVIDTENDFDCIDKFFLSYDTVKNIALRSTFISNNYKKDDIVINEKRQDYYSKQSYELFKIFYHLIKEKSTENCSRIAIEEYNEVAKLSKKLVPQEILPERAHPSGPCIPGTHRLFMNADGFFYPCERVSESSNLMQIGHIDTGFDIDKVKKILNIGKVNENACKNCWAIRLCGICASLIDSTEKEFSEKRKEEFCKKFKLSLEEKLKNYCFLKEFGHDFENNVEMNLNEVIK